MFVTHDIDEAVKLGDQVAVLRVGGKLAQYDAARSAARPAGRRLRRQLRRVATAATAGSGSGPSAALTLGELPTVALGKQASADAGWLLVVDDERRPQGWLNTAESTPDAPVRHEHLVPGGSLYDVGSGSLRSALDAALSSPSGVGVALDEQGVVAGSVSADDVLRVLDDARRDESGLRSAHDLGARQSQPIGELLLQHLAFAIPPILLGLVLAIPLGWLATATPCSAAAAQRFGAALHGALARAVRAPSAAAGHRHHQPGQAIVALTIYTVALLVRTVADGLPRCPRPSSTRHGHGVHPAAPVHQRRAADRRPGDPRRAPDRGGVSISLVTVGAVIGFGGLGKMFTDAFQRDIPAETIAGIVLVLLLALAVDGLIVLIGRALTPWARAG